MNYNPDEYYQRSEVSNSDLTALKELLHPGLHFGGREAAFRFGNLVDALITEPGRVNLYRRTVSDIQYDEAEFEHGLAMREALRKEASCDNFLCYVLDNAVTQSCMINPTQDFSYCSFPFTLPTRCKWDWWLTVGGFGGDLKTTSASTQREFEEAIDRFDWDRSRAWYMDIAGSDRDFIYAISKNNGKIFKHFINRGDDTYKRGREKYEELAFHYWCLNLK